MMLTAIKTSAILVLLMGGDAEAPWRAARHSMA